MAGKPGLQMMDIERGVPRRRAPEVPNIAPPPRRQGGGRAVSSYGRSRNRKNWYIRRRNQLLRRLGLLSVGLVLAVVAVVKLVGGFGGHVEEDNGRWENQNLLTRNSSRQQMSLVGEPGDAKGLIVLDAGHGGKDPGTSGGSIQEKDVNIAITKKLQEVLEERGYQVVMTREGDASVSLDERVEIAKDSKADLFVSIHQNALEDDFHTSGIQTYCCQKANGDSVKLADSIHQELLNATGAVDRQCIHDSDFQVVRTNPLPACLVETGFLTSDAERDKLTSSSYQDKLAQAVADGIEKYLEDSVSGSQEL